MPERNRLEAVDHAGGASALNSVGVAGLVRLEILFEIETMAVYPKK